MSLFKHIIKLASIKQMQESAAAGATSAGAVAGVRTSLMKPRRRKVPRGVKFEQEETMADQLARVKKESAARRAKIAASREERGYDSRSSGRLSSRFGSARDRISRPSHVLSLSTEQEENVDWNKEVDEFNKRRKDPVNQGRGRKSKFRARRPDRTSTAPMSLRFEQEEANPEQPKSKDWLRGHRDGKAGRSAATTGSSEYYKGWNVGTKEYGAATEQEEKVDWNKELAAFRERDAKSKPRRRKSRLSNRRMGGPTGSAFGLRFESEDSESMSALKAILAEAPGNEKFDPADVISKLRSAGEKAENEENTRGFALEDEDGNIVKVYVATEEADEFEQALGAALAGEDDDDDEENTSLEIAEVLFNLKDRFTIVDVEWPEVEEDQEDLATDATDVGNAEEDLNDDLEGNTEGGQEGDGSDLDVDLQGGEDGDLGGDMDADMDASAPPEGGGEMSALQSMIDLLKSQADAAKAEAQAREAEANAEEAKYNAQAAEAKVKQEEEVLNMEAHYDKKSQADKEAKKLAKLAKWKHETAQESVSPSVSADEEDQEVYGALEGDEIPGNKFEEPGPDENRNQRMEPGEFIKYMLMNARRNP